MSDALTIREATPADAPGIAALIESLAGFFLLDPADRSAAAPFFETIAPAAIAGSIADGRLRYHLAERGGELLGVVGVRDGTHLYHLFVAERAHRQGIALRLWEVARAASPGCVTVNSSLFAVPLYERLGFRAAGERQEKHGTAWLPMELAPLAARGAGAHLPPPPRDGEASMSEQRSGERDRHTYPNGEG